MAAEKSGIPDLGGPQEVGGLPSVDRPHPARAMTFEDSATRVLGRLSVAFSELLLGVPAKPGTASEVERALGVDYKLSWQIHRLATCANPLANGAHVPARVSMQKLLSASSRRRVPMAVIREVSEAFDAFEQFVEAEAGDRHELVSMLGALAPEVREKQELEIKKAAFKAMSHVKSVSMEAQVGAFLLHPSSDGTMVDRTTFSAYLGLRRLRAAAPIGFSTVSVTTPTSPVLTLDGHVPDGVHSILLPQFCSQPPPEFQVSTFGTHARYSVAGSRVGLSSAVDLVMAEHRPGAMKRYRQPDGRKTSGVMNLPDIPMKRQTTDIFLHKEVYPSSSPSFAVYDTVPRGMAGSLDDPARQVDRVLFEESVQSISGGLLQAELPHFPRYLDMLRFCCDKLGWKPADFRCFRLDVFFPVYGAQYMIGFDIPDAPSTG